MSRPSQVNVAFGFQLGIAAALLLCAGLMIADAFHMDGLIDEAARSVAGTDPAEVAQQRSWNVNSTLTTAIPAVLVAGWLAVLAPRVRRGSGLARGLSVAALASPIGFVPLVCVGFLAAGPAGSPDATPFSLRLEELYSVGFSDFVASMVSGLAMIGLTLSVVTIILLFTEPAGSWFRRVAPPGALTVPG
ncbi:hypothetical protein [Paractinoplanes durhamensis]|uniref:Uncharacterized protein n=1 Tax=Paractinoplanes durhamensis TaxID=113563 RepID=A0ABQ3Z3D6_9ACTN|nr:hypothetical protein [Actinoplanes durhamensis]GIE04347.1 hypothetical protein Adu01nite_56970 [Actinoplanes durhamensis]